MLALGCIWKAGLGSSVLPTVLTTIHTNCIAHIRGSWGDLSPQTRSRSSRNKSAPISCLPWQPESWSLCAWAERHMVRKFAAVFLTGVRNNEPMPLHSRSLYRFCNMSLQRPLMSRRQSVASVVGNRERKQSTAPGSHPHHHISVPITSLVPLVKASLHFS